MIIIEILTSLFIMGVASILSLVLISSVFGCLGFVLFWICILGFFIVFNISLKFLLGAILLFYLIGILSKVIRYYQLPNYDDYLSFNANAYQNSQAVCCKCGSNSITNLGLFGYYSKLRYFACVRCRSWLYRFKVL